MCAALHRRCPSACSPAPPPPPPRPAPQGRQIRIYRATARSKPIVTARGTCLTSARGKRAVKEQLAAKQQGQRDNYQASGALGGGVGRWAAHWAPGAGAAAQLSAAGAGEPRAADHLRRPPAPAPAPQAGNAKKAQSCVKNNPEYFDGFNGDPKDWSAVVAHMRRVRCQGQAGLCKAAGR